jgi:hypothetical protein
VTEGGAEDKEVRRVEKKDSISNIKRTNRDKRVLLVEHPDDCIEE